MISRLYWLIQFPYREKKCRRTSLLHQGTSTDKPNRKLIIEWYAKQQGKVRKEARNDLIFFPLKSSENTLKYAERTQLPLLQGAVFAKKSAPLNTI